MRSQDVIAMFVDRSWAAGYNSDQRLTDRQEIRPQAWSVEDQAGIPCAMEIHLSM